MGPRHPTFARVRSLRSKVGILRGIFSLVTDIANEAQLKEACLSKYIVYNIVPMKKELHNRTEVYEGDLVIMPPKRTLLRAIYLTRRFWISKESDIEKELGQMSYLEIMSLVEWMEGEFPELGEGQDNVFKVQVEDGWSPSKRHTVPVFESKVWAMEKQSFVQTKINDADEEDYNTIIAIARRKKDANGNDVLTEQGYRINYLPLDWNDERKVTLRIGLHPAILCAVGKASLDRKIRTFTSTQEYQSEELDEVLRWGEIYLQLLEMEDASQYRRTEGLLGEYGDAFRNPGMPDVVNTSTRKFPFDPREPFRAHCPPGGQLPVPQAAPAATTSIGSSVTPTVSPAMTGGASLTPSMTLPTTFSSSVPLPSSRAAYPSTPASTLSRAGPARAATRATATPDTNVALGSFHEHRTANAGGCKVEGSSSQKSQSSSDSSTGSDLVPEKRERKQYKPFDSNASTTQQANKKAKKESDDDKKHRKYADSAQSGDQSLRAGTCDDITVEKK